jgi:hypothetical protein
MCLVVARHLLMKKPDIEIAIHGSRESPRVAEIDATRIAEIIMRKARVREKPATQAANAIIDYLAEAFSSHTSTQ